MNEEELLEIFKSLDITDDAIDFAKNLVEKYGLDSFEWYIDTTPSFLREKLDVEIHVNDLKELILLEEDLKKTFFFRTKSVYDLQYIFRYIFDTYEWIMDTEDLIKYMCKKELIHVDYSYKTHIYFGKLATNEFKMFMRESYEKYLNSQL